MIKMINGFNGTSVGRGIVFSREGEVTSGSYRPLPVWTGADALVVLNNLEAVVSRWETEALVGLFNTRKEIEKAYDWLQS